MEKNKFRGRRVDNNEWVYGDYFVKGERAYITDKNLLDESFIHRKPNNGTHYMNTACYFVDKDTIGQFTNLSDKNGINIYEDDIVKALIDYGPGGEEMHTLQVSLNGFGIHLQHWIFNRYETLPTIIGNIHDNAELLEKEE